MAIPSDIIGPLKDQYSKASEVFVLLPQNAGQEMVAAASGLAGALKHVGKNVTLACPTPISNSAKNIPGASAITDSIGNRNLIISIKVDQRDSIDKVSYSLNEEEKIFNLVVQPKKGELPLKKDAVSFSYSGAQAHLLFLVGVNRFEDLGYFYESEKSLFTEAKSVCISRFTTTPYADFHITDSQVTGLAELTYELMDILGVSQSAESASALLLGIDTATQNLQSPNVGADTFEKVAKLMRTGGTRQIPRPNNPNLVSSSPAPAAVSNPQPVPQEWLAPKIYKASDTPASA